MNGPYVLIVHLLLKQFFTLITGIQFQQNLNVEPEHIVKLLKFHSLASKKQFVVLITLSQSAQVQPIAQDTM